MLPPVKLAELRDQLGFAAQFLIDGALSRARQHFRQTRLARLGGIRCRQPRQLLSLSRCAGRRHCRRSGCSLLTGSGRPPTQGAVSLAILGLLDRVDLRDMTADRAEHIHLVVETTKCAFILRDNYTNDPHSILRLMARLCLMARRTMRWLLIFVSTKPSRWVRRQVPLPAWAVIDDSGFTVFFIQSIYHEFGSGVVLSETGINW